MTQKRQLKEEILVHLQARNEDAIVAFIAIFFVSFKAKTLERRARLLTNFQSLGTRPKVSAAAASPRKNLIEMRASLFTKKEVPRRFDIPN